MSSVSEMQHTLADQASQIADRDKKIKKLQAEKDQLMAVIKRSRDKEEQLKATIQSYESQKSDIADELLSAKQSTKKANEDAKRIRNDARKMGQDAALKLVNEAKARASRIVTDAKNKKKDILAQADAEKNQIIETAKQNAQQTANDVRDEAAATINITQEHASQILKTARSNALAMNRGSEDARKFTEATLNKWKGFIESIKDFVNDPSWEDLQKPIEVDPLIEETADEYEDLEKSSQSRRSRKRKSNSKAADDPMMKSLKGEIEKRTKEYKSKHQPSEAEKKAKAVDTTIPDSAPEMNDTEYQDRLKDIISDAVNSNSTDDQA